MRLVIDLQGAQGSNRARGIGRYSRELALAMAAAPRGHEVIVALNSAPVASAADLATAFAKILPRAQVKLWQPPRDMPALHTAPMRRVAALVRGQFLAALAPDLVHVSSLFEGLHGDMITLQPPDLARLPVVATCYDLIPLIRHTEYFAAHGPLWHNAPWYYRCLHEMALSDGLLAISESSRGEAIRHLGFKPENVFNIQSGVSLRFRPTLLDEVDRAALLQRYGLRGAFILFLGAGDIRKNESGLITAYARLSPALRERHQLCIIGNVDAAGLYRHAAGLGVTAAELVIRPGVAEDDLSALYSACTLFVFPSLHEGFGLPVAEAMACGAPVIGSNTTSLPEVVGRADAMFDPADPDAIAACMRKVLENPALRDDLAKWGPVQAARFTWPATAGRAWDALEAIHAKQLDGKNSRAVLQPRRLTLAFVSPFPPQASGIADYSHELVFALAAFYDITLVTEAVIQDARLAAFLLLRPDEFADQVGFDRVLYQIGNSHFHRFQIEDLLARRPGMVVLHDVFLSDYVNHLAYLQGDPERFRETLLLSHGYDALRFEADNGRAAAIEKYPCSLGVLQAGIGVILHSRHAAEILERFHGAEAARPVPIIPHLRAPRPRQEKHAARKRLALNTDDFILCSFGIVSKAKCPDLIAQAWRRTGLAGQLVFVGEAAPEIAPADPQAGIICTGRVSAEDYDLWLAAADLAVQWRNTSRGETSGAIADILMAGLPLIFNRHGSAAELPDDIALGLPDCANAEALATAILGLHGDPASRQALGNAAQAYAMDALAPAQAAAQYFAAIEQAYAAAPAVAAMPLYAKAVGSALTDPGDLQAVAESLSRSFPAPFRTGQTPRLLVDISGHTSGGDASEIQLVLREIARNILQASNPAYRSTAVRIVNGSILEDFTEPLEMLGHRGLDLPDTPLDSGPGDILICAGVNPQLDDAAFDELQRLQLAGLRIILVVYDLFPLHQAEFVAATGSLVWAWYSRMLSIADGVACISKAGAEGLLDWLNAHPAIRRRALPIGQLQLGTDFQVADAIDPAPIEEIKALVDVAARPTVVMLGAIEVWGGHVQVLEAFELLWQNGGTLALTIAGRPRGGIAPLLGRLAASPEYGRLLHFLPDCSESISRELYHAAAGLLIASRHEAVGIALLKAADMGLPVLLRAQPALQERMQDYARYFQDDSPAALAACLQNWQDEGFTPRFEGMKLITWEESSRQLCDMVINQAWPAIWRPLQE